MSNPSESQGEAGISATISNEIQHGVYRPEEGFYVFFDFVLGLKSNHKSIQIVYQVLQGTVLLIVRRFTARIILMFQLESNFVSGCVFFYQKQITSWQ